MRAVTSAERRSGVRIDRRLHVFEDRRVDQRHVAVGDHDGAVARLERRQRNLNGVTGSALRLLDDAAHAEAVRAAARVRRSRRRRSRRCRPRAAPRARTTASAARTDRAAPSAARTSCACLCRPPERWPRLISTPRFPTRCCAARAVRPRYAAQRVERVAQAFAADVAAEQFHRVEQRHRCRAAGHRDVEQPRQVAQLPLQPLGNALEHRFDRRFVERLRRASSSHIASASARRTSSRSSFCALEQLRPRSACSRPAKKNASSGPRSLKPLDARLRQRGHSREPLAAAAPRRVRARRTRRARSSRRYLPLSQSSFATSNTGPPSERCARPRSARSARRASIISSPSADETHQQARES